jgi:hypothetical protein
MDYRSEFVRIIDQLRSEWENYKRYYPDTYDTMNSLVNLSAYLKVDPKNYDVLNRISKYLISMTADGTLFSESPICPELRELLTKFDAHISSKFELGNTTK